MSQLISGNGIDMTGGPGGRRPTRANGKPRQKADPLGERIAGGEVVVVTLDTPLKDIGITPLRLLGAAWKLGWAKVIRHQPSTLGELLYLLRR
jgi:hypothetical protein